MTMETTEEGRWSETELSAEKMRSLGPTPGLVDVAGRPVPCQFDRTAGAGAQVVARTEGRSGPFRFVPDGEPTAATIAVDTVAAWEGQESWRIQTEAATWYYHKKGGGFASLIDPQGNDWLSFRPWGGSDGIYRGIPNIAYPENVYHPGHDTCLTTMKAGPLRVTLDCRSKDDAWRCRWHVYGDHAELFVLKAGHPYWLLYEGTPAGTLDVEKDFCIRSDGLKRPLSESWVEILPQPKWIAFGKTGAQSKLWLWSHSEENADVRDSFWPMERNMTVFGFGREDMGMFMTHVPARFTVGLSGVPEEDLAGDIAMVGLRARL